MKVAQLATFVDQCLSEQRSKNLLTNQLSERKQGGNLVWNLRVTMSRIKCKHNKRLRLTNKQKR